MKRLHLTVYTVFMVILQVCGLQADVKCPEDCQCMSRGIVTGISVDCMFINEVPQFWPAGTKQINIYFRGYPKGGIPAGAFANLTGLRTIELRGKIGDIHPYAFSNLTGIVSSGKSMSQITIRSANVHKIHSGAFIRISNFNIKISLSRIHSFERESFLDVSNFVKFDIWASKISDIKERAFLGLHNIQSLSLRNTEIEVIYNFAFKGIHIVNAFTTLDVNVTICMGIYGFSGMNNIKTVDFEQSNFPVKPELKMPTQVDYNMLKCINGWDVPENGVWLFRHRINISLIISFTVIVLVVFLCMIGCLYSRPNNCNTSSSGSRESLTEESCCLTRCWICTYIKLQRANTRQNRISDNQPPAYSSQQAQTQEIPAITLPSYDDCLKMAPPYTPAQAPSSPPPSYANTPETDDTSAETTSGIEATVLNEQMQQTIQEHISNNSVSHVNVVDERTLPNSQNRHTLDR